MPRAPMTSLRAALVAAAVTILPCAAGPTGEAPPASAHTGPTAAPPSSCGSVEEPVPASPPASPSPKPKGTPQTPAKHGPAPDFSLPDLHGGLVESGYLSRPVTVVHFWASWCVPCMREIPELNRLAEQYEPSGAALYAVAIGSGSAGDLRQIEKSFSIHHRVLIGDDRVARSFGGVTSFPVTFLVDSRGWIVERHEGATREAHERIEETIRGLLAASGRPVPPRR